MQTITYTPDERVKLHSFGSFAQGKPLSQAEIIVAGGIGVGSKAGFEKLEALRWWDWDYEKIKRSIPAIQSGNMAALECEE